MSLYQLATYRRLAKTGRLLPAGPLKREPQPTPEIVTHQRPRLVMILSGHWQQMTTVFVGHRCGNDYVCVDTGYGKRWFTRAQLVRWALTYAGQNRKVGHVRPFAA